MEGEAETFVVDAQTVEHRGVEVADVHRVLGDVVGEVIGLAVGCSPFNAATCQPHAEAAAMVVTPAAERSLAVCSTAKLAPPDHQGVIEHAALLKIGHQSGRGLVGVLALGTQVFIQLTMLVPATVKELRKAHAALCHTARE